MADGCWVSAVRITNLGSSFISGMPGQDPLGALLSAIYFVRDVVDHRDGIFLFSEYEWESAGLPISLKGVSPPKDLAAIEAKALTLKYEAIEAAMALIAKPIDG